MGRIQPTYMKVISSIDPISTSRTCQLFGFQTSVGSTRAKISWFPLGTTTVFCCRFRWLSSFRTSLHRSWVKRTFPKRRFTIKVLISCLFLYHGKAPFETITIWGHCDFFFGWLFFPSIWKSHKSKQADLQPSTLGTKWVHDLKVDFRDQTPFNLKTC